MKMNEVIKNMESGNSGIGNLTEGILELIRLQREVPQYINPNLITEIVEVIEAYIEVDVDDINAWVSELYDM